MKIKKYLSVTISVLLIWLIIILSEKITNEAYAVFMYIAFGVILIVLFAYQMNLRFATIKTLTYKMNAQKFLKQYQELDGNKYTNDRYVLEALSFILLGDYIRAESLLKNIENKKDYVVKADALFVLCYYFSGNLERLTDAISILKMHVDTKNNKKYEYLLNYANLIEAIAFDGPLNLKLIDIYFNSIPKKSFIEVYIASYLLGEAKLKLGEMEKALDLFEHIIKTNCCSTTLYSKAKLKIDEIKNTDQSGDGSIIDS